MAIVANNFRYSIKNSGFSKAFYKKHPNFFILKSGWIRFSIIFLIVGVPFSELIIATFALMFSQEFLIKQRSLRLTCAFLFLDMLLLVGFLLNSEISGASLYYFLRFSRVTLLFMCFSVLFNRVEISAQQLLKTILFAVLIHSMLVLGQVFPNLTVRNFFWALNTTMPDYFRGFTYRAPGLTSGFDVAGLLIVFAIPPLFLLRGNAILKIFVALLGSLALFFTARTSILLSGLMLLAISFIRPTVRIAVVGLFICIALLVYVSVEINPSIAETPTAKFLAEPFVNLTQGNGFTTSSLDDFFSNHMTISHIDLSFFGDSFAPAVIDGLRSDVGYLQILQSSGLTGAVSLAVAILLLMIYATFDYLKFNCEIAITIIFVLLGLLIASLKGPYFGARQAFDLVIVYSAFLYSNKRHKC